MSTFREQPIILSGLEPEDLQSLLAGEPRFRRVQIFRWTQGGIPDFDAMSNIPAGLREHLRQTCLLQNTHPAEILRAEDGTAKFRIALADGLSIEAVLLTDNRGRRTACLSTQAGCAMGCAFCRTGTMGLKRNLTTAEIVEQYHHLGQGGNISNIVFMGMGEPFMNTDNLYKAIRILTHPDGPALSPRRLTISTCGIAPEIRTLAEKAPGVRLALSLPTADEETRKSLMPGASKYSPEDLQAALSAHQAEAGDRITLETVLFSGVNTKAGDARQLKDFADGLKVVVNVIPFNPFEGSPFKEPSAEELKRYIAVLETAGLKVTRRYRRGRGVLGACGQLAT